MGVDPDDPWQSPLASTSPQLESLLQGLAATPRRVLHAGEVFGAYRVQRLLGAGGMGEVYEARDSRLERSVALKVLKPGVWGNMVEAGRQRMVREALALAKLSHPNILTIYEIGVVEEEQFLATEFVDGATLRGWLAKSPRRPSEIRAVLAQAGRGLLAAHGVGLVHRDFKPDNVLVDLEGRARVSDFGLVTVAGPAPGEVGSVASTQTVSNVGTPAYMAPEQHAGERVDARSDQYGFCVTAYEALFGVLPFRVDLLPAMIAEKREGRVRPPPSGKGVSARLRAAILRGLEPGADQRHPSLAPLIAELERDPAAPRWRALAIAGAVAVAAGSAALAANRSRVQPCAGAGDKVTAAWSPARRTAVRRAFLATGKSYAAETFERVAARFDEQAAAWSAMRGEACEATAVRHEQSAELLDRRMACLDRRLEGMVSLAGQLAAGPDVDVLDNAIGAVNKLEPVAACADREALTAAVPPPTDKQVAARLAVLHERVAELKTLDNLGKWKGGVPLAEKLAVDARAVGWPPIEAETQYLLGDWRIGVGDGPGAEEAFKSAVVAAARARDDALGAWSMLMLLRCVGLTQGRPVDALAWRTMAEAAVVRAPASPRLAGGLHANLGVIFREKGDYPAAEVELRQAVKILEGSERGNEQMLGNVILDLAIILAGRGASDEAVALFRRAGDIYKTALGPSNPHHAYATANLAIQLQERGEYAEAQKQLREVTKVFAGAMGEGSMEVAESHQTLGEFALEVGDFDAAQPSLERGLELNVAALGADHPQSARSLRSLGSLEVQRGQVAEGEARAAKALALVEKARGKEHPDVASALLVLARAKQARGQAREALALVDQAGAIQEKSLGADAPGRSEERILRAELLLSLGRAADAEAEAGRVLAVRDKMAPQGIWVALAATAIAEARLAQGRAADARPLAERAVAIYDQRKIGAPAWVARARAALERAAK